MTTIRERMREMWGFPSAESVWRDVRYGGRMLSRTDLHDDRGAVRAPMPQGSLTGRQTWRCITPT